MFIELEKIKEVYEGKSKLLYSQQTIALKFYIKFFKDIMDKKEELLKDDSFMSRLDDLANFKGSRMLSTYDDYRLDSYIDIDKKDLLLAGWYGLCQNIGCVLGYDEESVVNNLVDATCKEINLDKKAEDEGEV